MTDTTTNEEQASGSVPYVSFATLNGLLDRIGAGAVPPRIDKSFLDTYSGGTQAILKAALRSLDLINDDDTKTEHLEPVAKNPQRRKDHFRSYLQRAYPAQALLAEQDGTAQQLEESFTAMGFKGSDTRRKAIVFYLNLVEYVGAPKSEYFRPPKQAAASAKRNRQRKNDQGSGSQGRDDQQLDPPAPKANVRTVRLVSGGTVTLEVSVDLFQMSTEDEAFVMGLIKKMRSYEEDGSLPPSRDEEEDDDSDEDG